MSSHQLPHPRTIVSADTEIPAITLHIHTDEGPTTANVIPATTSIHKDQRCQIVNDAGRPTAPKNFCHLAEFAGDLPVVMQLNAQLRGHALRFPHPPDDVVHRRPGQRHAPAKISRRLTGRRSGNRYRTPVMVFDTHDGLAIMLPYGLDRDWIRNLTAAGCARVQRYGKTVAVTNPRIVPFVCDALVLRLELRLVVVAPICNGCTGQAT